MRKKCSLTYIVFFFFVGGDKLATLSKSQKIIGHVNTCIYIISFFFLISLNMSNINFSDLNLSLISLCDLSLIKNSTDNVSFSLEIDENLEIKDGIDLKYTQPLVALDSFNIKYGIS